MVKPLIDVAKVIRSKNASPFDVTLDILFSSKADYQTVKRENTINAQLIAQKYNIPLHRVKKVIYFDPSSAVKICIKRDRPSGSPGDTDVYGAQQHAPLLSITVDI